MGRIVRNTLLVGFSEFFSKGISSLAIILLVRTLSPESFGIYSFAITLTYFFVGFLHSGFYTIGMRELSKYPNSITQYYSNVLSLKLIFSVLSYVVLCCVILFLDKPPDVKSAFFIVGLYLFILAFHIDWLFRGIEKMEFPAIASVLQGSILLIYFYFWVNSPNDYKTAVVGYVISWGFSVAFLNFVYFYKFKDFNLKFDKSLSLEILKMSLPISLSSLLIVVYANINVLILNLFKGDYDTGIYSAMIRLMNVLLIPNNILQIAFFPELSRSVVEGNLEYTQRKFLLSDFIIGFFLVFGMFGFSRESIALIFGNKYLAGDLVLRVSLVSCILSYFTASLVTATYALNRQNQFLKSSIIGGFVSISLNLILVPRFGSLGAVSSLVITELCVFLSLSFFNLKTKVLKSYTEVIKPLLIGILSIILAKLLALYTNSIVGVIIYALLFWFFVFLFKLFTIEQVKKILRINPQSNL